MPTDNNIAILTTVANFSLYGKSVNSFPAGIKKYVIDGTSGMYGLDSIRYMFKKLKNKGIEWLIMIDEDVIFTDPKMIYNCIEKMKVGNFTVCGMRDGGIINHRKFNPHLINTFFSILHFSEIEAIWNEKEMFRNQYVVPNEFDDDLSNLKTSYDPLSLFEPYYCFYLWLRRENKRFLFLEGAPAFKNDPLTNVMFGVNGQPMLYHTWLARAYDKEKEHTERIDKIIDSVSFGVNNDQITIFKDPNFWWKKKLKAKWKKIWSKLKTKTNKIPK